jgi:hypothetical protein
MSAVNVIVHTIRMGDSEDPDLLVAEPMWQWQQSESGKWIMDNSIGQPSWERLLDPNTFGYLYRIRATLEPKAYTYWKLKYE